MLNERRIEEEGELSRIEQGSQDIPQTFPTASSRQVSEERLPVESTLNLPADVGVILASLARKAQLNMHTLYSVPHSEAYYLFPLPPKISTGRCVQTWAQ